MYDVVPAVILDRIARQYERAVERSRKGFPRWRADEEFTTGALGSMMEQVVKGARTVGRHRYRWVTSAWAVLGKGQHAPELEYGADVVIEIELRDEQNKSLARKSLPVQAKKERPYSNTKLAEQAKQMAQLPGSGVVVSYAEQEFVACDAGVVVDAGGSWPKIPAELKSPFGRVLGQDFLRCRVGSRDTFYDARAKAFRTSDGKEIRLQVPRRIRTLIRKMIDKKAVISAMSSALSRDELESVAEGS